LRLAAAISSGIVRSTAALKVLNGLHIAQTNPSIVVTAMGACGHAQDIKTLEIICMLEQRRHPRIDVYWNIELEEADGSRTRMVAKNVSYGGVYVECERPYRPGAQYWVNFRILCRNGLCKVRARAEVIHMVFLRGDVGKIGMGLRFVEMDEMSSECLQTFLSERSAF
jgi:hypothetical protein